MPYDYRVGRDTRVDAPCNFYFWSAVIISVAAELIGNCCVLLYSVGPCVIGSLVLLKVTVVLLSLVTSIRRDAVYFGLYRLSRACPGSSTPIINDKPLMVVFKYVRPLLSVCKD